MALQANIPNRPTQVSANAAGLNEHLVKDAASTEPIDFQTRIDSELAALNQAVEAYNNDNGKTQTALINARQEVNRLAIELENAKRKLQELEQAGSAIQKYEASVSNAEGQFEKIVGLYTAKVHAEVVRGWFGQDIGLHAISKERKNDLKLHKRVTDLRKFAHVAPPGVDPRFKTAPNVANLNLRVDTIGEKFTDLREHIAADQVLKS
jgi:regulator of replication initiation timing